eukprot:TRINITY_DN67362_c7_g2_i2.p1 TRINITY_DN67362_c7_g2~~TRINITY_DN67362_c7_g2_i2.p1  ORF type:complete len:492 (+),score=61.28 TRINITY_DN67362_c7_g2_i2:30-1478(+)
MAQVPDLKLDFTWTQTKDRLEIVYHLADDIKAKDLSVEVAEKTIKVEHSQKGELLSWKLEKPLAKTLPDEVNWTVESKDSGKDLIFDLAKKSPEAWLYLIDRPLPYDETYYLSDEQLQKLRDDEKAEGAPTSGNDEGESLPEQEEEASPEEKETSGDELFQQGIKVYRESNGSGREWLHLLRVAAIHCGSTNACLQLYRLYSTENARGMEKKEMDVALWFLYFAAQKLNDRGANSVLGSAYQNGLFDRPKSFALSVKYFQKSAQGGDAHDMTHLSKMLQRGDFHPNKRPERQFLEKFVSLASEAAQRGAPTALYCLGQYCLEKQIGYKKGVAYLDAAGGMMPELKPYVAEIKNKHDTTAPAPSSPTSASKSPSSPTSASAAEKKPQPKFSAPSATPSGKRELEMVAQKGARGGGGGGLSFPGARGGPLMQGARGQFAAPQSGTKQAGVVGVKFWENVGTFAVTGLLCWTMWRLTPKSDMPGM